MIVHHEILTYEADGLAMRADLFDADPAAGPKPAVLLFPDALGAGHHVRERARHVALLGYAALACDLHGGGQRLASLAAAAAEVRALGREPQRLLARARAAFDVLAAVATVDAARIAAAGYCLGGTMALELARSGAPLAAVVGFHSGLANLAGLDARAIRGRVLVCLGAEDPTIDGAQRAAFEVEMRAAGVDWQMHLYGGVFHAFTDPDVGSFADPARARYDEAADARSWNAMTGLFAEVFGGG